MNPVAIIIWVVLIIAFAVVIIGPLLQRRKYVGQDMTPTKDWYQECQSKTKKGDKKAYFFQFDKHYLTQGHYLVDQDKNVVYEELVLFGDPIRGYEADFINHLTDYKHHHNFSNTVNTDVSDGNAGVALKSHYKFDGVNIWKVFEDLGYTYHLERKGLLAYQVDVKRNGKVVGTLYSSNGGKNYFGCQAPYEAKPGSNGYFIVESTPEDLDVLFLLAIAFTRTELSLENYK